MASVGFCLLWLSLPFLSLARGPPPTPLHRRAANSRNVPPEGFYDPRTGGGKMLTAVPDTFPMGLGEPLNAIIAGTSDEAVLKDTETEGGLRNYYLSLGFSGACLGQHAGSNQAVDLGDGHGFKNETDVMRWNYGDPAVGSCKETIQGGNHFRYWVQDGEKANSGAIFFAVSYELPIAQGHDIVRNGYNLGRDWLVGNITQQALSTSALSNTSTFSGQTKSSNYTYQTDVRYVSGLLDATSNGINHHLSVEEDGFPAIDGLVAVLNVKISERPSSAGRKTISFPSTLYVGSVYALALLPLCIALS